MYKSSNPLRKKIRKEVPLVQKFMEENFPEEIGKEAREYFRTERETSLPKTSGTERIVYFKPFLNCDMIIDQIPCGDDDIFEIGIKPVAWATAFIQRDIKSTTTFVLKAIVREECRRIIKANKIARDNTVKIIQRAVVFMMCKFNPKSYINPWSFPSSFDEIITKYPPPDDGAALMINYVLRCFDPRFEQDAPCHATPVEKLDGMYSISPATNFWDDRKIPDDLDEFLNKSALEETKYDDIFEKCVASLRDSNHGRDGRIDTAQIAAALTRITFPQSADQIVDATQFCDDRWKAAFKNGVISIGKIAAKLSATIIRLQFGDNVELMKSFCGVQSLSAVHALAIYRASKFLHKRKDISLGYQEIFDSQIPEHNVYPTVKECDQIDKEIFAGGKKLLGITWLKYNAKGHMGVGPSRTQHHITRSISRDLMILSSRQASIVGDQFVPSIAPLLYPTNTNTIEGSYVVSDSHHFTCKEGMFDQYQLRYLNGVEPILLKGLVQDATCIYLEVRIQEEMPYWTCENINRTHAFSKNTWTLAKENYYANGAVQMGKRLLSEIFDSDELREASPSGRQIRGNSSRKKLDENRQWQIIDTIHYLVAQGPNSLTNPDLYLGPWTNAVEKQIRTSVISAGTSRIRAALGTKKGLGSGGSMVLRFPHSSRHSVRNLPLPGVEQLREQADFPVSGSLTGTMETIIPLTFGNPTDPASSPGPVQTSDLDEFIIQVFSHTIGTDAADPMIEEIDVSHLPGSYSGSGTLHPKFSALLNHLINTPGLGKVQEINFVEPTLTQDTEQYVLSIVNYFKGDKIEESLDSLERFNIEISDFEISDRGVMDTLMESEIDCCLNCVMGHSVAKIVIKRKTTECSGI